MLWCHITCLCVWLLHLLDLLYKQKLFFTFIINLCTEWVMSACVSVIHPIFLSLLPSLYLHLPLFHSSTSCLSHSHDVSSLPMPPPLPISPFPFIVCSTCPFSPKPFLISLTLSNPLSICNQALSATVGLFVYQLQGHVFAKSEWDNRGWNRVVVLLVSDSHCLFPLAFVCSLSLSGQIFSLSSVFPLSPIC